MASVLAGSVIFLCWLLFIGGGTLIYYGIYRHNINKRLEQGITHKKGLMSPWWMSVILLAVSAFLSTPILVIIFLNLASSGAISEVKNVEVSKVEHVEVSVSMEIGFYTAEEMEEGFLSMYSMEENPGYTKNKQTIGEMEFTCFSAEELSESYHPHYLVYSDVVGTLPEDAVFLFEGTLCQDGSSIEGYSNIAYAKEMPICIISGMQEDAGRFDYDYELLLNCTVFDSASTSAVQAYVDGTGEFPEEAVIVHYEVDFDLDE